MAFNLNAVNVGLQFIQPNLRATTPQVKVNPMKSTPTITLIFTLVTSSVNAQAEKELLALKGIGPATIKQLKELGIKLKK